MHNYDNVFLVVFVNCACLTTKNKMADWRPSNASLGSDEADEEEIGAIISGAMKIVH